VEAEVRLQAIPRQVVAVQVEHMHVKLLHSREGHLIQLQLVLAALQRRQREQLAAIHGLTPRQKLSLKAGRQEQMVQLTIATEQAAQDRPQDVSAIKSSPVAAVERELLLRLYRAVAAVALDRLEREVMRA
jgi:hypothetical protein